MIIIIGLHTHTHTLILLFGEALWGTAGCFTGEGRGAEREGGLNVSACPHSDFIEGTRLAISVHEAESHSLQHQECLRTKLL